MIFGESGIVNNGLVGYFDGGIKGSISSGSTTWVNLAAQNSNATFVNMSGFSSSGGGSVPFTRQSYNTFLNLGDPSVFDFGAGEFAIEIWFNPSIINYTGSTQGTILCKNYLNIEITLYAGIVSSYFSAGGGTVTGLEWSNIATPTYTAGLWHQIVISRVSGVCRQYVNGVLCGLSNNSSNFTSNATGNWNIGSRTGEITGTKCFGGNIAIVRFYNRGLSTNEVNQNFQVNRKRFGI